MEEAVKKASEISSLMSSSEPHFLSKLRLKEEDNDHPQQEIYTDNKAIHDLVPSTYSEIFFSCVVNFAIDDWINIQNKRTENGELKKNSFIHKERILRIHLRNYLNTKNITTTSQINEETFNDYLIFRSGTSRISQSREITVISEWIQSYLMKNK